MATGWLGLDWGTVPAWTSSLLTSGSLLVAATAYRRSVLDKEREHATKLGVWVGPENAERVLFIENLGDAAVYEVSAKPFQSGTLEIGNVPAGSATKKILPAVEPQPTRTVMAQAGVGPVDLVLTRDSRGREPLPELSFRDAAGRWWRRDGRGNLRPAKAREVLNSTIGLYAFGICVVVVVFDTETGRWKPTRKARRFEGKESPWTHLGRGVVEAGTRKSKKSLSADPKTKE
ncbi:hypothetical protein [Nocardia sp. CA-120079]|uniref:hypothetical protein n=1 Tax=Nocardia sp. CA-120079 TaxID=3239974 RepID=UPI003D995C29